MHELGDVYGIYIYIFYNYMHDLGDVYGIYIYSRTICMIWETYMDYIYKLVLYA